MKPFIPACVSLAMTCATAVAEPIVDRTLPTGAPDIVDYKVSECDGLLGFGRIHYRKPLNVILTDFCFDEETGNFYSAEPLVGLELTAKSRNGRVYEDLASGNSEYTRKHVKIIPEENLPGCMPEPAESVHAKFNAPQSAEGKGQRHGYFIGYTFPTTAAQVGADKGDIYFGLRLIGPDPSGKATFRTGGIENAIGDFLSTAVFDGDSGTITINEGAGYNFGEASGTMSMTFPGDGTFNLTGTYAAKSLRLKGHKPNEMVETKGEVKYFRGHVMGSDGSGLLGYGIAEGQVTDASGKVHDYQAMAYLLSCVKPG